MQVAGNSGWKHHLERGGRGPDARGRVVSALFFFPRGGSAQVTRSLARALSAAGWQPTLAAGSLGQPDEPTHAASFFAGIDVHALDYSPARGAADLLHLHHLTPAAGIGGHVPAHRITAFVRRVTMSSSRAVPV